MLLKQQITANTWFGAALSIVGLYFLCVKDGFAIAYGDLIVLGLSLIHI